MVLVVSTGGLIVDLGVLRKNYNTSNFELKSYSCAFIKSDFQYSQGLVQMI